MLVLTRKTSESIHIEHDIKVTILEIRGNRVRLGIDAPPHIRVARTEILVKTDQRTLQFA